MSEQVDPLTVALQKAEYFGKLLSEIRSMVPNSDALTFDEIAPALAHILKSVDPGAASAVPLHHQSGHRCLTCATHGDPLICLACEAAEDQRPEWAAVRGLDLEAIRALARTHRMPKDPFAEQLSATIFLLLGALDTERQRADAFFRGREMLKVEVQELRASAVPLHPDTYFLAISGDTPVGKVVVGDDALRRELSEQFFGPEGPHTPAQRDEVEARWKRVCDRENEWGASGGKPFSWSEQGEDYHVEVFLVREPIAVLLPPQAPLRALIDDDVYALCRLLEAYTHPFVTELQTRVGALRGSPNVSHEVVAALEDVEKTRREQRLSIAEREHQRFAEVLSEFGFSDTDDVPLSAVLRSALVALTHEIDRLKARLSASSCEAPAKDVQEHERVSRGDGECDAPTTGSTAQTATSDVPSC